MRKPSHCPWEEAVLAAHWTGHWEPALERHARECAACADLLLVARHLTALPARDPDPDLPPPGLIWWKAQLEVRRELAERTLAPIRLCQTAAAAAALLLLPALVAWLGPVPVWLAAASLSAILIPAAGVLYLWRKA